MGDDVEAEPDGGRSESSAGDMVETDTVFEVTDRVFDHGMSAVIGFEFDGGPDAVGDERVVCVLGEQRELCAAGYPLDSHLSSEYR